MPAPAPTAVVVDVAPKAAGTLQVGKKLKVSAGVWNVRVSLKYQWFANGKKIKKATKAAYKLTAKEKGKKISVKVTASAPGMTAKVVTVKVKGKVKG